MSIKFGRFSAHITNEKTNLWNEADSLYSQKNYLESYEHLLKFLHHPEENGDEIENIEYKRVDDEIKFIIRQGSKEIYGTISLNNRKIDVYSYIAEFDKIGVAIMRRLLEMNYSLFYSRFALEENKIAIKFDTPIEGCPPEKLYFALKELSTRADKQDDILLDDFSTLKPCNYYIIEIPETEKNIKYKYFKKWIEEAFEKIGSFNNIEKHSGALSYILMSLNYRIDYLIAPEGTIASHLEKIASDYFATDNKTLSEKIEILEKEFKKILDLPEDKIKKDFYRAKYTFETNSAVSFDTIIGTFNRNLPNVDFYVKDNKENIALLVFEYIAGYCLFTYSLPKVMKNLLHLVLEILNEEYMKDLGFEEVLYNSATGELNSEKIIDRINNYIQNCKTDTEDEFPYLKFNTEGLKFNGLINFLKSYFNEIKKLNFSKE
ncbi:MAG: YbjN domain-containing protein [Ignavibacteria bacterium]|nr:YbjN domain-containing protein [Ignavibacteria bacterium]